MPRPTRQQRRARRREQAAAAESAAAQRALPRQQAVRRATEPVPAPAERERRGGGRFLAECWGELKKVDWPHQRQVLTGSVVVIIACAIVGAYLYGADLVFRPFVERVLLGR